MQIVFLSLKWLTGEASTFRPESLFSLIMDEESPLSHRDQLLGALAVIELRKARSYRWFYSKYRGLLKPRNEKNVKRVASIARFLEIVIRTGSRIRVSFEERGTRVTLALLKTIPEDIEGRHSEFPWMLLNQGISDLARELDRFIDYKVKSAKKLSSESAGTGEEEVEQEDGESAQRETAGPIEDDSRREAESRGVQSAK
jgi:hypothetical protein